MRSVWCDIFSVVYCVYCVHLVWTCNQLTGEQSDSLAATRDRRPGRPSVSVRVFDGPGQLRPILAVVCVSFRVPVGTFLYHRWTGNYWRAIWV